MVLRRLQNLVEPVVDDPLGYRSVNILSLCDGEQVIEAQMHFTSSVLPNQELLTKSIQAESWCVAHCLGTGGRTARE